MPRLIAEDEGYSLDEIKTALRRKLNDMGPDERETALRELERDPNLSDIVNEYRYPTPGGWTEEAFKPAAPVKLGGYLTRKGVTTPTEVEYGPTPEPPKKRVTWAPPSTPPVGAIPGVYWPGGMPTPPVGTEPYWRLPTAEEAIKAGGRAGIEAAKTVGRTFQGKKPFGLIEIGKPEETPPPRGLPEVVGRMGAGALGFGEPLTLEELRQQPPWMQAAMATGMGAPLESIFLAAQQAPAALRAATTGLKQRGRAVLATGERGAVGPFGAKEPWQMTGGEYMAWYRDEWAKTGVKGVPADTQWAGNKHEFLVKQALSEGKPVPAEVLADYPDLAAKAKPPVRRLTLAEQDFITQQKQVAEHEARLAARTEPPVFEVGDTLKVMGDERVVKKVEIDPNGERWYRVEGLNQRVNERQVSLPGVTPPAAKEPWQMTEREAGIFVIPDEVMGTPLGNKLASALGTLDKQIDITKEWKSLDSPLKQQIISSGWTVTTNRQGDRVLVSKTQSALADSMRHKVAVKQALSEGKLSVEDYNRLHAKDYGPIEQFAPDLAAKAKPPVKATALEKTQTYDDIQNLIDEKVSELEGKGLSFTEANVHPDVEALYQKRFNIENQELAQLHQTLEKHLVPLNLPKDVSDAILSDIYSIKEGPTEYAFVSKYLTETLSNPQTKERVARVLLDKWALSKGLDPDLIFSEMSGLSRTEQEALVLRFGQEAEQINKAVIAALSEVKPAVYRPEIGAVTKGLEAKVKPPVTEAVAFDWGGIKLHSNISPEMKQRLEEWASYLPVDFKKYVERIQVSETLGTSFVGKEGVKGVVYIQPNLNNPETFFHEIGHAMGLFSEEEATAFSHGILAKMKPPVTEIPKAEAVSLGAPPPVSPKPGITPPPEPEAFAANIRLSKYPEDIRGIIKEWADTHTTEIDAARRGIRSDAQVLEDARKLAEEVGGDFSKLQKSWKPGEAWNAEEITAIRGVLRSKTEDVLRIQQEIIKGANDSVTLLNLELALREQGSIQEMVHGVTAEAGRALRAFRQEAAEALTSNDVARMERILKAVGGRGKTEDTAAALAKLKDLNDPAKVNDFIRQIVKPGFWDYVIELYYNSILSGPKTHIVNSMSNTLTAVLSPVERGVAAAVERPLAAIQRRKPERFFHEVGTDVFGALEGVKDGVRGATFTLKKGVRPEQAAKWEMKPSAFGGKPGVVINAPSRALMAADELMRSINYRAALKSTAYRMARVEELKGKALIDRTADLVMNPTKELLAESRRIAAYRLFQQEPGQFISRLIGVRESRIYGVPILRFILPFIRTPSNLVKFGLERSPLGIFNPKLWQNLMAKNPEASDQLARWTIGSAVSAAIAAYFAEGRITGAAPTNRAERDRFYREGKQPFAIRIGDTWVSYQRVEPFNQPLSQVAAAILAIQNKDKTAEQQAIQAAYTIGENFVSQTYVSSLNDFLNAMADPDRYGSQFVGRFATGAIPFSAALRTTAQIQAPVVRQPQNILESMKTNIPGLAQGVPPRLDVFGQPIQRTTYTWLPIAMSPAQEDYLNQELSRMSIDIGFVGNTIRGTKLTPETQRSYQMVAGQLSKQSILNVLEYPAYKLQDDEIKQRLIEQSVNQSRQIARAAIDNFKPQDNPTFEDYFNMAKRAQAILQPYFDIENNVWAEYPPIVRQESDRISRETSNAREVQQALLKLLDDKSKPAGLGPTILKARYRIEEQRAKMKGNPQTKLYKTLAVYNKY